MASAIPELPPRCLACPTGMMSKPFIDETAHTAHVSVQTETATTTVGTTMHSIVNVREVCSMAAFSSRTQARMVSSEVQCSPSQPQMVQRAVQVTPARLATRNAASGTTSWHELNQNTMERMRANAREEVLEEFEPALEHVVVAAEVQVTRAAAKLEEARELKEAVRAGFESKARERQQQPLQTGEQQRRTEGWPPETVLIKKE